MAVDYAVAFGIWLGFGLLFAWSERGLRPKGGPAWAWSGRLGLALVLGAWAVALFLRPARVPVILAMALVGVTLCGAGLRSRPTVCSLVGFALGGDLTLRGWSALQVACPGA